MPKSVGGAIDHPYPFNGFTVVIPCYGTDLSLLLAAVNSVARQVDIASDAIEVVVVIDGDGRDLEKPLQTLRLDFPLMIVRLPENAGLSAARNAGLAVARHSHVVLLDADDHLAHNCLTVLRQRVKADPTRILTSNAMRFDNEPAVPAGIVDSSRYYDLFEKYIRRPENPIFHSIFWIHAFCFPTDALNALGGFNESLRCGELTEIMLRAFLAGLPVGHIGEILYHYRTGGQLSRAPEIHSNRMQALSGAFTKAFDLKVERIEPLGRVAPLGHFHYNLYTCDGLVELPYVDYENVCLREQ